MDDTFPMVVFKPLEHLTNGALVDVVNVTSYQRIEVRGIGMHPYNADGVAVFFGEKNVLFIFPMAGVRVVHDDIDFVIEDGVDELVETVLMCITNPRLLKAIVTMFIQKEGVGGANHRITVVFLCIRRFT